MADRDQDDRAGAAKRVFSLWPAATGVPSSPDMADLPAWARSDTPRTRRRFPSGADVFVGAAALAALALLLAGLTAGVVTAGLSAMCLALLLVALALLWKERRREDADAAWRDTLFERTGISLWREDWSAVGETILALKQRGVHDIEAYFAAHPDEARDLRRRVIVKDVNAFAAEMMGAGSKADLLGSLDRILPDSDQTFDQWLIAFGRGDTFYRSETHIVRPNGDHVDVLFTAELPTSLEGFRNILVTALDITDYKALQTKLVAAETDAARASRISTMGALTASIAHEVNTPLASILANVEASLRWLRRPQPNLPEAEQAIERAIRDAARAHEVVARTRDFLSAAPHAIQPVDMAEAARLAMVLIDRELRSHRASVHLDAAPGLPKVDADPIQMQQVLVNLMVNGLQAMKACAPPRDLRVTLRAQNDEVIVSVVDQGSGIDPTVRGKLFDPFFSRKDNGMGMGLAICRTCVEGHGGRIWAEANADRGATFAFSLPAAKPD